MKQIKVTNQTTSDTFTLYDSTNNTSLRAFEGFELASIKSAIETVPGFPGAAYVNSTFGRRKMTIEGDLFDPNVYSRRRDLIKVLRQEGDLKLFEITTYDDLTLQFEAEITRLVMPYTHTVQSYMLEVTAPDWRFYSQTESTDNINAGATGTVNNGGTESTHPVLTITGPADNVDIDNLTSGLGFTLSENLSAGESLEIDMQNQTVVLDGSTNKFSIYSGDFFTLDAGDNSIQFQADNTDGNTNLAVVYRDAYLGL